MTVGELALEEWKRYVVKYDMIRLPQTHVPLFQVQMVLESLGIWDAEVLEGTAVFDLRPDGGAPLVQIVKDDATWDIAFRDGQYVRVIVLKEE